MKSDFKFARRPTADGIAKKIHVTFPSQAKLADPLRQNIETIQQQNPDHSFHFYSDEQVVDFLRDEYGAGVLGYYERLNPKYGAARADLFRYLCIYAYGGVYLDVKARTTRPLSEVLRPDDQYILAQWDPDIEGGRFADWGLQKGLESILGGEYQQWHVIAAAGHPFLHAVVVQIFRNIDNYSPLKLGSGRPAVIRTTGPITYTQTIDPLLSQHPHRLVKIEKELGIYYSIYSRSEGAKHATHFANHYSRMTEPLVKTNWLTELAFKACQLAYFSAKNVRDKLLRRQPLS